MKRLLLAMLLGTAAMAAHGQSRTAQVIYTYHDPVKEDVFRVADECYAGIFTVEQWGWSVKLNRDTVDLTAEGKQISLPIRTVGGRQTIPLRLAFQKVGADVAWDDATNCLIAKSYVNGIKLQDGKLQISSSLPVSAKVFALDNPPRLVVDVLGSKLLEDAAVQLPANARMKQFKPDVVRVVVETPDAAKLVPPDLKPNLNTVLSMDPNAPIEAAPAPEPTATENPDADASLDGTATPPKTSTPAPPVESGGPQLLVDLEGSQSLLVLIRNLGELTGPVQFRKPDPVTLDVILPGAKISLPQGFQLNTKSIVNTISVLGENVSVLRFTLARPMGAQVTSENGEVRIVLDKPVVGNGELAGKVVVIDPGHGGHDTGARSGKVYEKNLTLSIAKKTADALAAAGATVVMTRKTDVFIPLLERNAIADRDQADFFISIHINSNTVANSLSGGIAFHHKNSEISTVLAECIQNQIRQVSKLPNLGVWSDGKIYQSGFSVLRNASQPAILLELGFINHSRDRARLQTEDFQNSVADAIVKGLQDYLGNAKS